MKEYQTTIKNTLGEVLTYRNYFLSYTHTMAHAEHVANSHAQFKDCVKSIEIEEVI